MNVESRRPYDSLVRALKHTPPATPSPQFTGNVMKAILAVPPASTVTAESIEPDGWARIRRLIWPPSAGVRECVLCYYLAGFFLMTMSVVVSLGLWSLPASTSITNWLSWQPVINLSFAVLFFASALMMQFQKPLAWCAARLTATAFIGGSGLNGLLMSRLPHDPISVHVGVMSALGPILLGGFLLLTIHFCQSDRLGPWMFSPIDPQFRDDCQNDGKGVMNDKGFTMIEVLVVLIIMGIVTAIAFNHAYSNRVELMAQTEVLKTHLRYAQARAMNADQTWGIRIDAGGSSYSLFHYDGAINLKRLPGESQDLVDLSTKGITMSPEGLYTFDARGIPYYEATGNPPGTALSVINTVTLSQDEDSKTVTITPNTGFIP